MNWSCDDRNIDDVWWSLTWLLTTDPRPHVCNSDLRIMLNIELNYKWWQLVTNSLYFFQVCDCVHDKNMKTDISGEIRCFVKDSTRSRLHIPMSYQFSLWSGQVYMRKRIQVITKQWLFQYSMRMIIIQVVNRHDFITYKTQYLNIFNKGRSQIIKMEI